MDDLKTPTPRELAILKVLWDLGPCSVKQVHQELIRAEPDLAYNTVQTMLRVMEQKSLVDHALDGRTFVYTARLTRDENASRYLDRVFDGAAADLIQSLLRSERVSPDELERMHALIQDARRKNRGR